MNRNRWGLVAALMLGVATGASGQDELRLQQVLERTLAGNLESRVLDATLAASAARADRDGAWPEPQVSWAVAPHTFDNDAIGDRHVFTLSQPLVVSGRLGVRREAARADQAAAADDLQDLRLSLAAQARELYARWHYVHRALAINGDNRALLGELAAAALSAYGAGRGGQQGVVSAQLREAMLEREALSLERQRRQLRAALNTLMGAPVDAELPLPAGLPRLPAGPDLVALQAALRDHNVQLRALTDRERAGELRVDVARRERWPDLRLMANYLGTLDPPDKRLQVGIGVQLPLNQAARRAAIDEAAAMAARAQWQRRDLQLRLERELSDRWASAQDADAQIRLYRESLLPLAAQNRAAAEADWRGGAGDFLAVIDALQDELDAHLAHERARVAAWQARAALDRLTGGALTAALFDETEQ